MSFELRELAAGDGCNALSLGNPAFAPLKSFLRKEAKKLHEEHLARTFVLVPEGESRVMAYISTLCTHVAGEQFDEQAVLEGFRYKDYRLCIQRTGPQLHFLACCVICLRSLTAFC